jgi:hypothetical protein
VTRPAIAEPKPSTADVSAVEGRPSTSDIRRFAEAHGRQGWLTPSELATWRCRLDVERERLRPYPIGADPLPASVSRAAGRSFDGFVYLLACRGAAYPIGPAPWAADFAAAWCGVSARQAKDARIELVHMGALVHVGDCGRLKLWLPWGVDVREAAA